MTTDYEIRGWAGTPAVRVLTGVLRLKAVPHRFEPLAVAELQHVVTHDRSLRGPLLLVDGRTVAGARPIRDFLEDRHPQPPLRPRDICAAALCHVLEDWAEEGLAWRIAALRWLVPANRAAAATAAAGAFPAPLRVVGARAVSAAMRAVLRGRGIGPRDLPGAEAAFFRDLDELDRLLHDRDCLLGEPHGRSMADLVVAAHLDSLSGTTYEESMRGRPSLWRWLRATAETWR